jgi:flagellar assembly protein FliH
MRMAVNGTVTEVDEGGHGERRGTVTPLIFESVERRKANLKQAGVDLMKEAARAQEEAAVLEGLRGQIRGIPAQVEAARIEGRLEGRAAAERDALVRIDEERAAVARACAQMAKDREVYFSEVEGEVVRLALGIAERILHREAKMDPLLLAASVRLALEKIAGESGALLRVPVSAVERWRGIFGDAEVEVVGDDRLLAGDCVLETKVGRVELGVAVQLEEIERGFFDLLQTRPS